MKIALIGGGAMGEAITASLLRGAIVQQAEVTVAERYGERRAELAERYGVRVTASGADAVADAGYVVLAVKPQDYEKAATEIAGKLAPAATAVSIMAGVTLSTMRTTLKHDAAVRAIPNTPAQVGEGMTVWTATPEVTESARADVGRIFGCLGRHVEVAEERYIDMATAISGSGPGFVFLFIEAFIDAAVYIGFGRDVATEMVLQTVGGSARYAQEMAQHPAVLRALVSSPGGTTVEGLQVLEAHALRAAVTEAVIATYNKSKALGGAATNK